MNKKVYIIIFITILFLLAGSILFHTFFVAQSNKITPQQAEKLCYSVFGKKDEVIGFTLSFAFINQL